MKDRVLDWATREHRWRCGWSLADTLSVWDWSEGRTNALIREGAIATAAPAEAESC